MCMKTVKNRCLKYIIRTYGEGKITKIKDGLIYIKFKDEEHSFGYPAGFTNGFLEMK